MGILSLKKNISAKSGGILSLKRNDEEEVRQTQAFKTKLDSFVKFDANRTAQRDKITLPTKFDYSPQPKRNIFQKIGDVNKYVGDALNAGNAAAFKTASLWSQDSSLPRRLGGLVERKTLTSLNPNPHRFFAMIK